MKSKQQLTKLSPSRDTARRTERRMVRLSVVCVALAALVLGASPADAQQCISPAAKKNLTNCPAGKFSSKNLSKKPQVSFKSGIKGFEGNKRKNDIKPINPSDMKDLAQRDARAGRLRPKVRKLLLTEISGVERLYQSTPKNDKDRPRLLRRLAEGYVELESSAFRDKIEAEVKAQNAARKGKKTLASKYKKKVTSAKKIIKRARKQAIRYYRKLKKGYPKYCQYPRNPVGKRGCMDEVLYYLAYEYEQAGRYEKARKAYVELTENWKKSKYVPNAFLAFGELFFNEAQKDPSKWDIAGNFYRKVEEFPPPDNKLWGYAIYKLGYVYWNQNKYQEAIDQFKKVIEFGQKYPSLPNAKGLVRSARRDIVPVYALKGDPSKAYSYFKPLSGDKSGNTKTIDMMESLGQNLLDTGHYPEAIVLYKDLKNRNKGSKSCEYQAQITKAVMASKSGQKVPIVAELESQIKLYKSFQASGNKSADKLKCANQTAGLVTETAMAWHLEAVGSGGVRGTGDDKTMKHSADLYELVVTNFKAEQFRAFKFPRIVKEDWPTISKVRYAMADLLYFQKNWEKCGPAFDAVVEEDPNGPNAAEAAFAAVLCYKNVWAKKHMDGSHLKGRDNINDKAPSAGDKAKFAEKPLSEEQKGMIQAFNRYVCYIKPGGDKEAQEQYVDVKYARARTYYEAQHWEEAAEAFRDIAITYPKTSAAVYAARLYLESLNILLYKVEKTRDSCLEPMGTDAPIFVKSFCEGKKKEENEEQCAIFFRVVRDVKRGKAEQLVKSCDEGKATGCIKKYEQAGKLYYDLFKEYSEQDCLDEKPGCKGSEELLYNSANAYQAARLIAKAIQVRKLLISEKYHLAKTDAARKAVFQIGGNYQAIAVYDKAAAWYEKFARENEKMENAPSAMTDAVVLRLGLGHHEKALDDAKFFKRKWGRKKPEESAQISFAIGAHHADREDWRSAEQALNRTSMAQIDKNATIDVKLQAHALLGRVFARQSKTRQADSEYGKVRSSWSNPAKMEADIRKIGGGEVAQIKRLTKSLTAVGEATYYFAKKKQAAADKLKFPEYKGSGERADVNKFIQSKVKDWKGKKEAAIKAAAGEYLKVVKIRPAPPPRWVIAAGAAVGGMWGRFVADFRSAPYPKEWDKAGDSPFGEPGNPNSPPLLWAEIRANYLSALDAASEGQKRQARGAYQTCLSYSVKYQYFDKDSRSCEEWLSKNYPAEFHIIDEFRGAPTRINSGLDEKPQFLELGGLGAVLDTRKNEAAASKKDEK